MTQDKSANISDIATKLIEHLNSPENADNPEKKAAIRRTLEVLLKFKEDNLPKNIRGQIRKAIPLKNPLQKMKSLLHRVSASPTKPDDKSISSATWNTDVSGITQPTSSITHHPDTESEEIQDKESTNMASELIRKIGEGGIYLKEKSGKLEELKLGAQKHEAYHDIPRKRLLELLTNKESTGETNDFLSTFIMKYPDGLNSIIDKMFSLNPSDSELGQHPKTHIIFTNDHLIIQTVNIGTSSDKLFNLPSVEIPELDSLNFGTTKSKDKFSTQEALLRAYAGDPGSWIQRSRCKVTYDEKTNKFHLEMHSVVEAFGCDADKIIEGTKRGLQQNTSEVEAFDCDADRIIEDKTHGLQQNASEKTKPSIDKLPDTRLGRMKKKLQDVLRRRKSRLASDKENINPNSNPNKKI